MGVIKALDGNAAIAHGVMREQLIAEDLKFPLPLHRG